MTDESLAQTVARLAALEDIRTLKAEYCLYCDQGYAPDALAALFTEDAVWDGGARGVFRGREAIRDFFAEVSAVFPYAGHLVTNPIIQVEGDRASGKWRMLMPCVMSSPEGETSAMQCSEYDETYTRIDGRWLIASLKVSRRRITFPGAEWSAK